MTTAKQLDILASFLREDYYFDEKGGYVEMSIRGTDYFTYNVMMSDILWNEKNETLIQKDDDGYFFTSPRGFIEFDFDNEEDVVCGDLTEDYYATPCELAPEYKECEDYTVIWIHPVKGGTICLDLGDYTISGGENVSYDTPSAFVVVGGEVYPLEWRE